MRNLLLKQFKELSKIYELDASEALTKKKDSINNEIKS